MVDEVQDLTAAQLAVVLKTLQGASQFLLCGDSNQIVHPNFFAWSRTKGLCWGDPEIAGRQELKVLATNFRNGSEVTRVANTLLRVPPTVRLDRPGEQFPGESRGGLAGRVALVQDEEAHLRELDAKIRQSARFAVLVMREEDKSEAIKASLSYPRIDVVTSQRSAKPRPPIGSPASMLSSKTGSPDFSPEPCTCAERSATFSSPANGR